MNNVIGDQIISNKSETVNLCPDMSDPVPHLYHLLSLLYIMLTFSSYQLHCLFNHPILLYTLHLITNAFYTYSPMMYVKYKISVTLYSQVKSYTYSLVYMHFYLLLSTRYMPYYAETCTHTDIRYYQQCVLS